MIMQDDMRVLEIGRAPPSSRMSWGLPASVGRAHAIDVGAGINRIDQQTIQRRTTWTTPLQLTFLRPTLQADWQLDAIRRKVAQNLAYGVMLII
jgi:hypothetical protein